MSEQDDGAPDDLHRDFLFAAQYGFLVDVPAGDYAVGVITGRQAGENRTVVGFEGGAAWPVNSGRGSYEELRRVVTVTDGTLNLAIGGNGRVNGVRITPLPRPTGLAVAGPTLGAKPAVSLTWDAMDGASEYRVYRAEGDGAFEALGTAGHASYVDNTAALGLSYRYAVTQVNADGSESPQGDATAVTVADPSVPEPRAPRDLNLTATSKANTLTWDKARGARAYQVFGADAPDGPYSLDGTATGTRFSDPDAPVKARYYRVFAANDGGLSTSYASAAAPVTRRMPRQMEDLDRGLLAVPTGGGNLVSWRLLGGDPAGVTFRLTRDGVPVYDGPATNFLDASGAPGQDYELRAVVGGTARPAETASAWDQSYLDLPLSRPEGGTTPDGVEYTYRANDVSPGDLDGDGDYELIVKWDPSNSKDNSQTGHTGEVFLDAYTLEGELLWRISMGRNIRAGAHYTQFMVYDLDGDGRAELVMKTADGTVDGVGTVIGDPAADYRNSTGYVLDGPEFLTVFDGLTGEALSTVDYNPPRGDGCNWGDCGGNRGDRFLAGVAYLDGERPSVVFARGYYERTVLVAYDWRRGELTERWVFDSDTAGRVYEERGNHNLAVIDVDGDGRDEIVYGSLTLDDDGTAMYTTGLHHGDSLHVGDLDPAHPGYEVFGTHERRDSPCGYEIHDADSGEILWCVRTDRDTGRGAAGDIDPRHPGAEAWAVDGAFNSPTGGLHTATGELISTSIPAANHLIWWDGDLTREILDHDWVEPLGVGTIGKWDPSTSTTTRLLTATGTYANNYTKGNPGLQADILGDWREEVMWRTEDSSALRIHATPFATEHRLTTLMHDPTYRLAIAWQNVAYNQPPHPGFFLGDGMAAPPAPILRGDERARAVEVSARVDPASARIALPRGYDVKDVGAVRLIVNGVAVEATGVRGVHGGLRATFDDDAVDALLEGYDGRIEVAVTVYVDDGTVLQGRALLK